MISIKDLRGMQVISIGSRGWTRLPQLSRRGLSGLPSKVSIEGHTDSKPYAATRDYGNWELSTDRAHAARRLMQQSGLRQDQVSQVRGYSDQKLRKPSDPLDPSNRRITLIVQYIVKNDEERDRPSGTTADLKSVGSEPAEH